MKFSTCVRFRLALLAIAGLCTASCGSQIAPFGAVNKHSGTDSPITVLGGSMNFTTPGTVNWSPSGSNIGIQSTRPVDASSLSFENFLDSNKNGLQSLIVANYPVVITLHADNGDGNTPDVARGTKISYTAGASATVTIEPLTSDDKLAANGGTNDSIYRKKALCSTTGKCENLSSIDVSINGSAATTYTCNKAIIDGVVSDHGKCKIFIGPK